VRAPRAASLRLRPCRLRLRTLRLRLRTLRLRSRSLRLWSRRLWLRSCSLWHVPRLWSRLLHSLRTRLLHSLWTRLPSRWRLLDYLLPHLLRRLLVPSLWARCARLRLLLNPPWLLLSPCLRSALDPLYRSLLSGLSARSRLLLHYDPWLSLRSRRLLSRGLSLRG
jgi:hypothetical protein